MHHWLRFMHMMVYYFRKALSVLRATWRSQPDQNIAVRILTYVISVTVILSQISSPSKTAVHTTSVLLSSSMHTGLCLFYWGPRSQLPFAHP